MSNYITTEERCGNCKFFRSGSSKGTCRIIPPKLRESLTTDRYGNKAWVGVWPPVAVNDWCGAWTEKVIDEGVQEIK